MSLGGQKKAIVLLVNDSGLQLLAWANGALVRKQAFRSTPEQLEQFSAALDAYRNLPVIMLTDLIEESFRHDSVVHVTGSDRTAVLKRKLDFVFRNTQYRLAKVTEREQTGRRDDRILMSAITKPDLIDVWVKALIEKRFAIQSITSVAHLQHNFAKIAKLDQEDFLLIINVEPGSNLRQTFIRKGMVMFSRLTPMPARDITLLGSDILQETLQLRQYFERIQFVPYEAALRIQVYSSCDDKILQLEARSSESNRFEVFDTGPLLAAMQVDLQDQVPSPVYYFLGKVLTGQQPENIYAPPAATKYQDLQSFSRMVWISTAVVVLLGLGISTPAALSVYDQWQQRDTFLAQARPLEAQYDALTERFPETPIPSSEMQLVVETHQNIEKQVHSPIAMLNLISSALALSPGLQLTDITWEVAAKPADTSNEEESDDEGSRPARANSRNANQPEGVIALVLANQTAIKVVINGEAYSPGSFREAQDQVVAFVDALAQNPGVSIYASRMPTDVRTDISVTTTVDDGEVRAPFTLELTLTEPEPVEAATDEEAQ